MCRWCRMVYGVLCLGLLVPHGLYAKDYTLPELYRMALEHAEKIKVSEQDVVIAALDKDKAVAGLRPRISGFASHTQYSREITNDWGGLVQPKHSGTWGAKVEEQLSLSMREITAVSMAKKTVEKGMLDLDSVREEYLQDVAAGYYEVLKSQKELEIADANLKRLETYRLAAQKRVQFGEAAHAILLRAESELSNARAERIKAENDLEVNKAVLARMTGIEEEYHLVPEAENARTILPLEELRSKAHARRADLRALDYEKKIAEQNIRFIKGQHWPSINLSGGSQVSHQSPSDEDLNRQSLYGTLSLNIPLFQGGMVKADVAQATARLRQAELKYQDLKKNIDVQIETAYRDVVSQQAMLKYLEDQCTYTNENYHALVRQFELGFASNLDVVDANALLVTSEQKLAQAKCECQVSLVRLKKAAGVFLNELALSTKSVEDLIGKHPFLEPYPKIDGWEPGQSSWNGSYCH